MSTRNANQHRDHFGKQLVDVVAGLLFGALIGMAYALFLHRRIDDLTNVFHSVIAMRYAVLSAAVAGAIAAVLSRRVNSAEIWWVSILCAALFGAIAGSLVGFFEPIWPPHVLPVLKQYSVFELGLAAIIPGVISSLFLGGLNRRKKVRLTYETDDLPAPTQQTPAPSGSYGDYTEF